MKASTRCIVVMIVAAFMQSTTLHACKVPVFRYALERWPSDHYRVVAIINGMANDDQQQALSALKSLSTSSINVDTEVVDLATLTDAELWQVEGLEDTNAAPLLQVFYPPRDGQQRLCWSGKLTAANVNAWAESPLRKQLISDIQSGDSAVWLLVEGSDVSENTRLLTELEYALAEAAKGITIPDGVIRRDEASSYLSQHPEASMDDVLRSDVPLRVDFSIRRLDADNDDEVALRAMIRGFAEELEPPFVLPVFGRGRMIDPLPASKFNNNAILAACKYLVGECSCRVKAQNPGVDLILTADWQSKLGDAIVMVDTPISTEPVSIEIPTGASPAPEATHEVDQVDRIDKVDTQNAPAKTSLWAVIGIAMVVGSIVGSLTVLVLRKLA